MRTAAASRRAQRPEVMPMLFSWVTDDRGRARLAMTPAPSAALFRSAELGSAATWGGREFLWRPRSDETGRSHRFGEVGFADPLRLCLVGLVPLAGAAALREVLAGLDEAVELGDIGGFRPELRRIGQATRRTDSVQPRGPRFHGFGPPKMLHAGPHAGCCGVGVTPYQNPRNFLPHFPSTASYISLTISTMKLDMNETAKSRRPSLALGRAGGRDLCTRPATMLLASLGVAYQLHGGVPGTRNRAPPAGPTFRFSSARVPRCVHACAAAFVSPAPFI